MKALLSSGNPSQAEVAARQLAGGISLERASDSLYLASVLDQLAIALRRNGKSVNAETREVCERSLRIKELVVDREDSSYAFSLQNLGATLLNAGDYGGAGPHLERTLRIRRRIFGPKHLDVATSLVWLGNLHSRTGDYAAAESLMVQALGIRRTELPPGDPSIGECCSALGVVLTNRGDLAGAIPLFEEAIAIHRERLGPNHPALAEAHHNLGVTLSEAGDFTDARSHLEEALRIRRRSQDANHPLTASTLTVLGSTLEATGHFKQARTRYQEGLRIRLAALGENNEGTAWTMMKLGLLEQKQGRRSASEELLRRALTIQHKTLGEDHYDTAWTLIGLAALAEDRGENEKAVATLQRALRIQLKTYGNLGPEVASTHAVLARVLARSGRYEEAFAEALRGAELGREHLRLATQGFAERQALAYATSRAYGLDTALWLSCERASRTDWSRAVWDELVRTRTLVLDETIWRQQVTASTSEDSVASQMAAQLDRARQRYANLLVAGTGAQPEGYSARLRSARLEVEQRERTLAAVVRASKRTDEHDGIGLDQVLGSLSPRDCLVAYALFRDPEDRPHYMAFVLFKDGDPRTVPLGPARTLDSLIVRWTASFAALASHSRSHTSGISEGQELARRIWIPVSDRIPSGARVYIVPDGAMYRVSFAGLPISPDRYLAEEGFGVLYLSSERDLVETRPPPRGVGILALGNPRFDRGSGGRGGQPSTESMDCLDLRTAFFEPLPESEREVREIIDIWPEKESAVLLTGASATESAVKTMAPGRRLLHLATHGFFLDGSCASASTGTRGIGGTAAKLSGKHRQPRREMLRLSGLALSGANRTAHPDAADEDGILTAQEIATLDLASLQLAVLSACDTGFGEIQVWEGVLGLRRAFHASGARTIIMSLWAVEDRAARAWMTTLYRALFAERRDVVDAVNEASLAVLRDRRARGLATHPFYWAAFVASGGDS